MKSAFNRFVIVLGLLFICSFATFAQTSAFTYQGRLSDSSVPANGSYTMKFRLYDADTLGNQVGVEKTVMVTVTNGIFTVGLDFGASSYQAGSVRWLEVEIGTTILSPRQQLLSSPYAVRAADSNLADGLSASCNPCVTDSQIVGIDGGKVSGTVTQADTANTAGTVSGIVGIANGGTGSTTKNFVDLTTTQTIGGNKTFTGVLSGDGSGLTNIPGTITWSKLQFGGDVTAQSSHGYVIDLQEGGSGGPNEATTINLVSMPLGDSVTVSNLSNNLGLSIKPGFERVIVGKGTQFNLSTWTPRESVRNWKGVASSADGTKLVAVASSQNIYTSTDSGETWTPRDSSRSWAAVASSADGIKLVAVTSSGMIYTSTDSGQIWTPRESSRSWKAVASSADGTKLVAVVFNGQIYTSTDSGVTWAPRESSRTWFGVASSADGTKLVAVVNNGQIYTSTDSGATWAPRESSRSWRGVASSTDGTKLVAVGSSEIYTSDNSGVTWAPRESSRSWVGAASSADGTKLVAVASSQKIYTSTDSGVTWAPRESNRIWEAVTASADGKILAAVGNSNIYVSQANSDVISTTTLDGGYISVGEGASVEIINGGVKSIFPIPTPRIERFLIISSSGDIEFY